MQKRSQTQNINRLGGAGSRVRNAIYPTCPTCARTMPILAQLDGATPFDGAVDWERWTYGVIYAFWCHDCRTSAITSQQS